MSITVHKVSVFGLSKFGGVFLLLFNDFMDKFIRFV